jgi:predicted transposase YbfD/YdcC
MSAAFSARQYRPQRGNAVGGIPELLATLPLEGCIVTINAMGTQPKIAQAIRHLGAD